MMRKDNPLLLRLRPVVWVLAVVFGLVGSTLQAQRSPRFDYFYMEAAKSFRNDEMGAALELFSHCMEIDSTAALKHGISVLNSPGTIDADYRGEICVILVNLSEEPFIVNDGERIAQMVIARHEQAEWEQVDVLDQTERGAGGFGHSGVK